MIVTIKNATMLATLAHSRFSALLPRSCVCASASVPRLKKKKRREQLRHVLQIGRQDRMRAKAHTHKKKHFLLLNSEKERYGEKKGKSAIR